MGKSKRREKPDTSTMASASSEPEITRDTVVNISEGTNITTVHGDDAANNLVTVHANPLIMRESGEVQPDMNPRAPPPPYQEHDNFRPLISSPPVRPVFHSSILTAPPSSFYPPPPRSSPPPAYSQLDLSDQILRPAPPENPLGGATRHLPSQHGGALPKKLHLQQQQMTNKDITAALRKVGGIANNQRVVDITLKEEVEEEVDEMSGQKKTGVAVAIFVLMFFVLYLLLPYTVFSPWED